ncbi:MAG: AIM24 family protein [Actinomycetales bacterium]
MTFEKVNSKVVKVNLAAAGEVLARRGAMLFYTGQVGFTPENAALGGGGGGYPMPGMGTQMPGMPGRGGGGFAGQMMGAMGRSLAGENEAMMRARGQGEVYYGRSGLHCTIVPVQGATLTVEASRLLGHTASLQSSIVSVASASGGGGGGGGGLRGMLRGAVASVATGQGMFTTQLSGQGSAVLLSHGGTLELQVGQHPVVVDPQAYVGHIGNISIELSTAMSWRDAVGRGSGEAMQLKLMGQGVVFVQASEQKL